MIKIRLTSKNVFYIPEEHMDFRSSIMDWLISGELINSDGEDD